MAPRTKRKPLVIDADSDIGGRVRHQISFPRFLNNSINRKLKEDKRFGGNRSRLMQVAVERLLKEDATEAQA